jgi:hypothetical protein
MQTTGILFVSVIQDNTNHRLFSIKITISCFAVKIISSGVPHFPQKKENSEIRTRFVAFSSILQKS